MSATKTSETMSLVAGLGKTDLLEMCYFMHLARATEERLETLMRQGHVLGGVYRSLGQEAGAVGLAAPAVAGQDVQEGRRRRGRGRRPALRQERELGDRAQAGHAAALAAALLERGRRL